MVGRADAFELYCKEVIISVAVQTPAECLSCRASRTLSTNLPAFTACGHPKDARSIGIGRGTKCRRPMYKRTHNASTPCGSPREGLCARRPTRGRGGRGASFSAVKLKCVTPALVGVTECNAAVRMRVACRSVQLSCE